MTMASAQFGRDYADDEYWKPKRNVWKNDFENREKEEEKNTHEKFEHRVLLI